MMRQIPSGVGISFGATLGALFTDGEVLESKLDVTDGSLEGAPFILGAELGLNDGAEQEGKIKLITNVFWIWSRDKNSISMLVMAGFCVIVT